jgi:outer membrane protein OmpA-like peptidoglycan-associated protein
LIVFAGITALIVTGYFAIFFERGEGPLRSVRFVPAELQKQAGAALKTAGVTWAQVHMDGQKAIMTGTAPSVADKEEAVMIVRRSAGPGGTLWGGVTTVDADFITIEPPRKPYTWRAVRGGDGEVSLGGVVPGRRMKQSIAAEARKLFPQAVLDKTQVASGQPTGDWEATAILGLKLLAKMQSGEAQFEDGTLRMLGVVPDAIIQSDINEGIKRVKRPYKGAAELTMLPFATASAEAPAEATTPEADPADADEPKPDAPNCMELIDAAMRTNVIRFKAASSDVGAADKAILDRLKLAAQSCGSVSVKISGHSDGTPAETVPVDFSRKRREKTMAECLANELLDASNGLGAAIKRRDDMQKMADSNRAFAHYRY